MPNPNHNANPNDTIVVIYHSGYGHTQRVAQKVADGAGAELIAIDSDGNISPEDWQLLDDAKAIVFGSPTYMGNVSWQFKKFADASSKAWFARAWQDKLFAGFTNSASMSCDKQMSLLTMQTLASQHGGLWISAGLAPNNAKAAKRDDTNFLGYFAGLMTQSPSDSSAGEMSAGDLNNARLFGERIAAVAEKYRYRD